MSILPRRQAGIGFAHLPAAASAVCRKPDIRVRRGAPVLPNDRIAPPASFDHEGAVLPLNAALDTANSRHGDLGDEFTAHCIMARQGQSSAIRFGPAAPQPLKSADALQSCSILDGAGADTGTPCAKEGIRR